MIPSRLNASQSVAFELFWVPSCPGVRHISSAYAPMPKEIMRVDTKCVANSFRRSRGQRHQGCARGEAQRLDDFSVRLLFVERTHRAHAARRESESMHVVYSSVFAGRRRIECAPAVGDTQTCCALVRMPTVRRGGLRSVLTKSKLSDSKRGSPIPESWLVSNSKSPSEVQSPRVWPIFVG